MTLRQRFLKLLSRLTFKPLFKGYGITSDPILSVMNDPTSANLDQVTFYNVRSDLGVFEIRRVIETHGDKVRYLVYHVGSDLEFKMSKESFEFFFEPMKTSGIPSNFDLPKN